MLYQITYFESDNNRCRIEIDRMLPEYSGGWVMHARHAKHLSCRSDLPDASKTFYVDLMGVEGIERLILGRYQVDVFKPSTFSWGAVLPHVLYVVHAHLGADGPLNEVAAPRVQPMNSLEREQQKRQTEKT